VKSPYQSETGEAPQDTAFIRIHAALPQTQCTRCGYADCAAYAQAIALREEAINQCPPGGAEGVRRLAAITGQQVVALNPANGTEGPRAVAVIDEDWCIGCTLCLDVCPTDAILGSNKLMHTVIEACCTGCELCIPVCPVDCISLDKVTGERTGWDAWSPGEADIALSRYETHLKRIAHNAGTGKTHVEPDLPEGPDEAASNNSASTQSDTKRAVIDAALAQARAVRLNKTGKSRP
jgi:electron transport complex protein RnfB